MSCDVLQLHDSMKKNWHPVLTLKTAALLPHLAGGESSIAPITARFACYNLERQKECPHGAPAW